MDSGRTLVNCAEYLDKSGAKKIYAFAVHGIMTDPDVVKVIEESPIDELVLSNTIGEDMRKSSSKIHYVSIAKMVAETIAQATFNKTLDQLKAENII